MDQRCGKGARESRPTLTPVPDRGPTFTMQANRSWTLNIRSQNATTWTYVGTAGGVKPIGDLAWSTASGGAFAAITNADAIFTAGASATSGTPAQAFFRTSWAGGCGEQRASSGIVVANKCQQCFLQDCIQLDAGHPRCLQPRCDLYPHGAVTSDRRYCIQLSPSYARQFLTRIAGDFHRNPTAVRARPNVLLRIS